MKCFLDMDEVLTDFDAAVQALGPEAAAGLAADANEVQKQTMYDAIEKAGENFWSEMKWKDGGREIWKLVKPFDPVLLTSPGDFSFAESGKTLWVKNHIPGTQLFFSDSKSEYIDPYDTSILIDDSKANCAAWEECGGKPILHTNWEGTESQFLELLWGLPERIDVTEKYWPKKEALTLWSLL